MPNLMLDETLTVFRRFLEGSPSWRGQLITIVIENVQEHLPLAADEVHRQRLSQGIQLADAILVHFDGTEEYDRTAICSALSDGKSILAQSGHGSGMDPEEVEVFEETLSFIRAFKRPRIEDTPIFKGLKAMLDGVREATDGVKKG